MDILAEIEKYISTFNIMNHIQFSIDSIRIEFSKQHKRDRLYALGNWNKLHPNDRTIIEKLKKKTNAKKITSVYKLEGHNIYYYNSNKDKPKYRKATMVIFGMKQYHRSPPQREVVKSILSILKNITCIDLCFDLPYKPSINNIQTHFNLKRYFNTKTKCFTDTYYINKTNIPMIEKIIIYNKKTKNNLDFECWRIESLITIPNIKHIALPLDEFKKIIDLSS